MKLATSSVETHDGTRRFDAPGWLDLMDRLDAAERNGQEPVVLALIDLMLDVFDEGA
jgi:hypothetical protein